MKVNIGLNKNKSMGKITLLVVPFLYFFILLLISYFVGKTGYAKIKSQRKDVISAKKTENILVEKEAELKTIKEISNYIKPVSIALPDKNPALILISQIKYLSNLNDLNLGDFKIGSMAGDEANSKLNLSFSLSGSYLNVFSFLTGTKTLLPILTLQKAEFGFQEDMASAEIILNSFWAPYPEKLPPVTEPILKLTDDNINTLGRVSVFTPPVFSTLNPSGPIQRANPFF